METTTNLGLKKPAETEFYDVNDFNENADKIDAAVSQLETAMQENASRAAWSGVPESGTVVHPGIYNITSSEEWPAGLTLPDELSSLYEGWADNEEELTLISDGCNYFLTYTKSINGGPRRVQVKKFWFRNTGDALYGWVQIFDTEA